MAGKGPPRIVGQVSALASSPYKKLADQYLPRGSGAVLTFGLRGGRDAGRSFVDRLKLLSHLANIGDAKSLVIHPLPRRISSYRRREQVAAGITPDLVRLSVGIEDIDDILAYRISIRNDGLMPDATCNPGIAAGVLFLRRSRAEHRLRGHSIQTVKIMTAFTF